MKISSHDINPVWHNGRRSFCWKVVWLYSSWTKWYYSAYNFRLILPIAIDPNSRRLRKKRLTWDIYRNRKRRRRMWIKTRGQTWVLINSVQVCIWIIFCDLYDYDHVSFLYVKLSKVIISTVTCDSSHPAHCHQPVSSLGRLEQRT